MLQWFNKQANSGSLNDAKVANQQHSPLSDSALSENDHEFLFNQLLDGVAHGWHLGRIIKFFNNLQPRSNPSYWIAWLERFEQKIVYAADPSQRRVGAIMMRFGELTFSCEELKQLGEVFHRIGKKLLIGDTTELILEYDGLDRVVEDNNQPAAELTENLSSATSEVAIVDRALEANPHETVELTENQEVSFVPSEDEIVDRALEANPHETVESIENQEVSFAPSEDEIKDIKIEQSLEVIEEFLRSEPDLSLDNVVSLSEQPTQSPDLVLDSEDSAANIETTENEPHFTDSDSIESLKTLTEQLTVLQDATPESEVPEAVDLTGGNEERPRADIIPRRWDARRLSSEAEDKGMVADVSEEEAYSTPVLTSDPVSRVANERRSSTTEDFTEQPTQSPDWESESASLAENNNSENIETTENEPQITDSDSIESLAALTEQLTVLQDTPPEPDLPSDNPDDEITLVAPETEKPDPSTPLSVASFLEAAKALVPQQKNNTIPLTWEEFVVVLEQDETLAQQVARHLQITSTDPQDIVEATVNRLNKQEATKLSPATIELVESWFNLGLKQASAEDFQGAIASWDKALKLNPNLSEAWHNRGSALGRLAKYEEAIHSFNRAINLTPGRYQAWNDRAHALYQLKKWEQAVESWDKAISIVSDNYQFWYNRGCALEQLQRFDESISSYEKTLEIKPDFQPARSRYINLVTERSSSSPN